MKTGGELFDVYALPCKFSNSSSAFTRKNLFSAFQIESFILFKLYYVFQNFFIYLFYSMYILCCFFSIIKFIFFSGIFFYLINKRIKIVLKSDLIYIFYWVAKIPFIFLNCSTFKGSIYNYLKLLRLFYSIGKCRNYDWQGNKFSYFFSLHNWCKIEKLNELITGGI